MIKILRKGTAGTISGNFIPSDNKKTYTWQTEISGYTGNDDKLKIRWYDVKDVTDEELGSMTEKVFEFLDINKPNFTITRN